ncbi:hypothetical protein PVNG_02478 [Plasmodium vivax North Korean]|uniref:30S ribosomal protein S2 n=1 Tax=Plasmodium vivax North Korean TaxID=1035514 RepID=A0A0J9TKV7_PLAVI|nr:hypothetical protein PVNG_02478 [Plasmodium vivax North Korean]
MLEELDERLHQDNLTQQLTKKEISQLRKKKEKIEKSYDGIKNLVKLPNVVVVFNPVNDIIPILEARKMDIPVVGIVNSNNNPDLVNFAIPANNSSPKSIYLLANLLCDAIAEAVGEETLIAYKDSAEINLPSHLESINIQTISKK